MVIARWALATAVVAMLATAPTAFGGQNDIRLKPLFEKLQTQGLQAHEAATITQAIWSLWMNADDSNVNRLMREGVRAMNMQNLEAALEIFDRMVKYAPEFAEGWNKRATVHYMLGNFEASVRDIERTLALEPRHFGALSGLGMINMELDRHEQALKAFESALKVHPYLPGAQQNMRELLKKIQGSPT
jgi:tetratricopeptide (TPR) repeat protein